MSLSGMVYFSVATAYATLAFLLWWQVVPTLIARRGRFQAMGVWLIGMAMACFVSGRLTLALSDAPVAWSILAGDACLIGAAIVELVRAKHMGGHRWNRCIGDAA